jgi:hypothetical protein
MNLDRFDLERQGVGARGAAAGAYVRYQYLVTG